jgi:hypothetical protein
MLGLKVISMEYYTQAAIKEKHKQVLPQPARILGHD